MMRNEYAKLFEYLSEKENKIAEFLKKDKINVLLRPADIYTGTTSYLYRPAKRLRPAVLLMACGSVNDSINEDIIMPAAAGIELFHTWTLVHDDLIDNDEMRRGGPSVHCEIKKLYNENTRFTRDDAIEYGKVIAILSGDMLQAWSVKLFASLAEAEGIESSVVLKLITILETEVMSHLIYGETLDVQYSFNYRTIERLLEIEEEEIVDMLWLKTGVLYSFSATAGAMLGKNTSDENDADVAALQKFASNCGTAFQLQDDILGIVGDERSLGKPVGSDIREGKITTIVLEAFRNADTKQREYLSSILGNRAATLHDIEKARELLAALNGIDYTKRLAREYVKKAMPYLDNIKASRYKNLLLLWANYMIDREF